jgi:hypothetical protein
MPLIECERLVKRKIFAADNEPMKAKVPKGYQVTAIDKRTFLGWCEACAKPICEGDSYGTDEDHSCIVCRACYPEIIQA